MQKRLPLLISSLLLIGQCGFAQSPPQLNSFTDTAGTTSLNLYIDISPNDTGLIHAQVQLTQGTGFVVYDSTYTFPAKDSNSVLLNVGPLSFCTSYALLFNLSNAKAQGSVDNPLLNFSTLCTSQIESVPVSQYSLVNDGRELKILCSEVQPNTFAEVFDLSGRRIAETRLTQTTQTISTNAAQAIYLLRVFNSTQLLYSAKFASF